MDGVSAPQRVGRDLGEADRANSACFDEARQFADCVFDRNRFFDAMNIVEVDVVDAEPLARGVERVAHMGRAVVEKARAVLTPTDCKLGRQRHLAAAGFVLGQELADHLLAKSVAIDIGGVPEIDAEFERPRQRPH